MGENALEILIKAANQTGPGLASAQQSIQSFASQSGQATATLQDRFAALASSVAQIRPAISSVATVQQQMNAITKELTGNTAALNTVTATQRQIYASAHAEVTRQTQALVDQGRAERQVREEVQRLTAAQQGQAQGAAAATAQTSAAATAAASLGRQIVGAAAAFLSVQAVISLVTASLRKFI